MSFKDRTFCFSPVQVHTCGREFTPELRKEAIKWWGGEDFPLSVGYFCGENKHQEWEYIRNKDEVIP